MDYAALRDELVNDPVGMGYHDHIQDGISNDVKLAELLNDPTSVGSGTISMEFVPRNQFLIGVSPAAILLADKDAIVQAKWDRLLMFASSVDHISMNNPVIQGMMSLAIQDGILSQDQIDSFSKRTGSRAEMLFGEGTRVTHTDVAIALRSVS